jgi:hypothetical protein
MISIGFKSDKEHILTHLSVISEQDSCTYGLFNNNILFESGRFNNDELFDFVSQPVYQDTKIYFCSKSQAFAHAGIEELNLLQNKLRFKNKLSSEKIFTLFQDQNFNSFQNLNSQSVNHFSTVLHHHYIFSQHPICFAYLGKTSVTICICGNGGFKFYNSFDISSAEDLLYYIKSVLQATHTSESEVKVILAGYIEEGFDYYRLVYRYFLQVMLAHNSIFSVNNSKIKSHAYYDHYLNIQCP